MGLANGPPDSVSFTNPRRYLQAELYLSGPWQRKSLLFFDIASGSGRTMSAPRQSLPVVVVDAFRSRFVNKHNSRFQIAMGDKTMQSVSIRVVFLSFVAMALSLAAFGQGGATGAITGTVQDPSGAFVGNADVRITNQDTNVLERSVKTGTDGTFTAPLLPVGTYRVSIQAAGFTEGKFADVVVRVTETTRMIAKLTTQSVQQTIEVQ